MKSEPSPGGLPERLSWRAHFSRFALAEEKPDPVIAIDPGARTRIRARRVDLDVDDEELIEGVAAGWGSPHASRRRREQSSQRCRSTLVRAAA